MDATPPYICAATDTCCQGTCKSGPCDCDQGSSCGDPHILTRDGLLYDLQVTGDFILATTDTGFAVQARQTTVTGRPGLTWNTAIAVQLGSHRINVIAGPMINGIDGPMRISIDGVPTTLVNNVPFGLPGGDSLVLSPGAPPILVVRRATGESVQITGGWYYPLLQATVSISGPSRGILGNGNGDPASDLVIRNGPALSYPPTYAELYGVFAPSWLVQPQESLFDDIVFSSSGSGSGGMGGAPASSSAGGADAGAPVPGGAGGSRASSSVGGGPGAGGSLVDPTCVGNGDPQTDHNPQWPLHAAGTCADDSGFTEAQAAAACGGDVQYFSYACSDLPGNQHTWTAYYGCCTAPSAGMHKGNRPQYGGLPLPHAAAFSVPKVVFTVADLPPAEREEAERICAAAGVSNRGLLDACTIDVAVLGDATLAQPYSTMPVPRLVLTPPTKESPPGVDPDNASTDQHACSAGRTSRATPWSWIFFVAAAAYGTRLANRRRRS
jgi:hypothetical protein